MAKGAIRGVIWGVLLGGAGVVSASLIGPQPAGHTPPSAPQTDGPQVVDAAPAPAPAPAIAPDSGSGDATDEIAVTTTTPQVTAPLPTPVLPEAETTSLPAPPAAEVSGTLSAPAVPEAPQLATTGDAPVLPAPQSRAPSTPTIEGNLVVETTPPAPVLVEEPATPAAPDAVAEAPAAADDAADDEVIVQALPVEEPTPVTPDETVTAVAPEATPAPQPVAEDTHAATADVADTVTAADAATVAAEAETVAPVTDVATTDAGVADAVAALEPVNDTVEVIETQTEPAAPAADAETVAGTAAENADTAAPSAVVAGTDVTPTPEEDPAETAETTEADPGTEEIPATEIAEAVTPAPETEAGEAAEDTRAPVVVSLIDRPSNSLPTGTSGVKINRVFGSEAAPADVPEETEEAPAAPAPDPTGPALEVHAAPFENPEGKPLMSLVLLDDPGMAEAPSVVAMLGVPVTVLIDAAGADARDRMAAYRAAGVEVGATLSVPAGALPTDVAVAMEAVLADLGQAVVLTDLGSADRAGREQIISQLSGEGRGFLTVSKGLNNGLRAAEAAGVPVSAVFRDLDAEDQDARVIRRFMDQAAFRARQGEGVVLLGRVRPDTLSALTLWGSANRAGQVALAPVSAILTAGE